MTRPWAAGIAAVAAVAIIACGGAPASAPTAESGPVTLRFGYFPNLTHATALVALGKGFVASALGSDVTLEPFAWRSLMAGELLVIVGNRPSLGQRLQFAATSPTRSSCSR